MSILRIASRYAKSLFDVAVANGSVEKVNEDINNIYEVTKQDDFNDFLKNPLISPQRKKDVIKAIFVDKFNISEDTLRMVDLLLEHKRDPYMRSVCRVFVDLYKKKHGISVATLTTAVEISNELRDEIVTTFQNEGFLLGKVELDTKVDPNIIGGFVLSMGDNVYDASIQNVIGELNSKFNENLYIKNL